MFMGFKIFWQKLCNSFSFPKKVNGCTVSVLQLKPYWIGFNVLKTKKPDFFTLIDGKIVEGIKSETTLGGTIIFSNRHNS